MMRVHCERCPRRCGEKSFCGVPIGAAAVARTGLHFDEEPCISGTKGSGTVFFAGCNLGCVFCQNAAISQNPKVYRLFSPAALGETFKRLETLGAHNINLVTATHVVPEVIAALKAYRPKIPVVYNTAAFEFAETIDLLSSYVDVWLPDLKFCDSALSERLCHAPDYFETALAAIKRMRKFAPQDVFDKEGLLVRGVLVRHLVLPSHVTDSCRVLDALAEIQPLPRLSLMCQYVPPIGLQYPDINRRLTTFEYNKAVAHANALGFEGFSQSRASASPSYIPNWGEFV